MLGAISAATGKTIIGKVLTAASNGAASKIKITFDKWKNKDNIAAAYKKASLVRFVKTFVSLEKPIDIYKFYVPAKIKIGDSVIQIYSIEEFHQESISVILGIAGQGKSIFLRFLCAQELASGKRLPLFIELRKIPANHDLLSIIKRSLNDFGFTTDSNELIEHLLNNDFIALFLDGFDEIDDAEKSRISDEIERLHTKFEKLRVIVSSRPDAGIDVSPLCHTYKICGLERGDYQSIINKAIGLDEGGSMIRNLEKNERVLRDLLSTPLMVTLLIITYKSFTRIPDQLSEFYEDLFDMLMSRHDVIKRFSRKRLAHLNNIEYRDIFESFCIISKHHHGPLKKSHLVEMSTRALKQEHKTSDPEKYIDDIIKITCLIIPDGTTYKFIHKSIQEYYGAAYIKRQTDLIAQQVYTDLRIKMGYNQELFYLSKIDRYRYLIYYKIPLIESFFDQSSAAILALIPNLEEKRNILSRVYGDLNMTFVIDGKNPRKPLKGFGLTSFKLTESDKIFPNDYAFRGLFQCHFDNYDQIIKLANKLTTPVASDGNAETEHRYSVAFPRMMSVDSLVELIWNSFNQHSLSIVRDEINESIDLRSKEADKEGFFKSILE